MTTLFYVGSLLVLLGSIWLVILSVLGGRTIGEKVLWGLANLIFQPLAGIIFFIIKRTGLIPLLLVLIGTVLMLVAYPSMMRGMIGTIPV